LLVDGKVIVELKVAKAYNPQDEPQLLNQLKARAGNRSRAAHQFRKRKSRIQTLCFLTKIRVSSVSISGAL
jgi:hypothetical protein